MIQPNYRKDYQQKQQGKLSKESKVLVFLYNKGTFTTAMYIFKKMKLCSHLPLFLNKPYLISLTQHRFILIQLIILTRVIRVTNGLLPLRVLCKGNQLNSN